MDLRWATGNSVTTSVAAVTVARSVDRDDNTTPGARGGALGIVERRLVRVGAHTQRAHGE